MALKAARFIGADPSHLQPPGALESQVAVEQQNSILNLQVECLAGSLNEPPNYGSLAQTIEGISSPCRTSLHIPPVLFCTIPGLHCFV